MNAAEYLVKKLEELGVNDFFGLPGDYNFTSQCLKVTRLHHLRYYWSLDCHRMPFRSTF